MTQTLEATTETLQEFCDWRGARMRADRTTGVIRGVKILGLQSRNGRAYLPDALRQAAPLYEGAKVNVNHPKHAVGAPRDYRDRMGVIRGVAAADDGLFADFHFNPKHALAEQLLWDAEHAPENVGFSHNVEARTARRGDQLVVEAILRVQSVDLVADPATTRGLFESQTDGRAAMTLDDLKRDHADLVEALVEERAGEIRRLEAEVARLTEAESLHRKRETARQLLRRFHLPDGEEGDSQAAAIAGPRFLESLLAAADEEAMRELVEERARLVRMLRGDATGAAGLGIPLSRDQHLAEHAAPMDARAFAEAITW